ncbi:FAD-binding protein [Lentilitoribacter sp. EG35]|uniref:FAD-binding protein n=1 Tax=Lentilitoribacter sp. EG35 TaxID=3234192 RepID=UPI00345F2A95
MTMQNIVAPTSSEELVEVVAQAYRDIEAIEIKGAGTKRPIGYNVASDIQLEMSQLSGIVEYTASELVMSANAGTSLDLVKAALDENNQMLAFEPADYSILLGTTGNQTMGGIFAANLSGSRRLVTGAARDGLLGINFVNGKGQLIKTGGKVMKNVTGLDLVKFLAGSWGTLGIMRDVTFKVLPKQEVTTTIIIHGLGDREATEAMALAMAQSVEVSAAAHLPQSLSNTVLDGKFSGKSMTMLRLEGLELSVKVRKEKLQAIMHKYGDISFLDTSNSAALWTEMSNVKPFHERAKASIWKVSVAPSDGYKVVAELSNMSDIDAFYDWQGGLVWIADNTVGNVGAVRQAVQKVGSGYATLLKKSAELDEPVDIFEPQNAAVATLSERIKHQFDPNYILNPGRMYREYDTSQKAAS